MHVWVSTDSVRIQLNVVSKSQLLGTVFGGVKKNRAIRGQRAMLLSKPNQFSGLSVFRRGDDVPGFVAYRILCTQYLMVVFDNGRITAHIASFSEVLDAIPVASVTIPLSLRVEDTLDGTLATWRRQIFSYLTEANRSC